MSFKPNDKVIVYSGTNVFQARVIGYRGGDTSLLLVGDGDKPVHVHAKQCRRLVKKERRRVWINPNSIEGTGLIRDVCISTTPANNCIEFVEVKKKP